MELLFKFDDTFVELFHILYFNKPVNDSRLDKIMIHD